MKTAAALVTLTLLALPAQARLRFRILPHHSSGSVSTRHRLTVNSLITEPGTFEWEWYGSSTPAVPTVWKVNPWGPTEFSMGFDAVNGADGWHPTDHVSLAATTALPSIGLLQLAVAPTLTFLTRNDSGVRAGAVLLGKVETGRHTAGFSTSWSGANHSSDSNPAGLLDFGGGYGFRLFDGVTAHTSVVWEHATGFNPTTTVSGGVEWQVQRTLALDVTVQSDSTVIGGLTWNLGKVRHR